MYFFVIVLVRILRTFFYSFVILDDSLYCLLITQSFEYIYEMVIKLCVYKYIERIHWSALYIFVVMDSSLEDTFLNRFSAEIMICERYCLKLLDRIPIFVIIFLPIFKKFSFHSPKCTSYCTIEWNARAWYLTETRDKIPLTEQPSGHAPRGTPHARYYFAMSPVDSVQWLNNFEAECVMTQYFKGWPLIPKIPENY